MNQAIQLDRGLVYAGGFAYSTIESYKQLMDSYCWTTISTAIILLFSSPDSLEQVASTSAV